MCVDYGKKGGDWQVERIGEWALTEDSISQETQKNKNTLSLLAECWEVQCQPWSTVTSSYLELITQLLSFCKQR